MNRKHLCIALLAVFFLPWGCSRQVSKSVIIVPDSAIKNLTQRIRSFYRNYLSITTYHWYYPEGVERMKAHVNFGLDEQWGRFYPYGPKAAPGATVDIAVKIMNHSDARETFFVEPHVPEGFKITPPPCIHRNKPQTNRTKKIPNKDTG